MRNLLQKWMKTRAVLLNLKTISRVSLYFKVMATVVSIEFNPERWVKFAT